MERLIKVNDIWCLELIRNKQTKPLRANQLNIYHEFNNL